jgi:lipopolysaccharide transport system ATP-binding protein
MKPAIRIENLSKRYRVVTGPNGGTNATEFLTRAVKDTWRKVKTLADPGAMEEENTFWALKDVSFEVQPGEVVGVIGRNGAGKSTLLKILSRIVEPTGGRAEIRGRLGSLLEVGTGFHPELSGRENVFLNGAVLGMSRKEIAKKFDEIVAFSGVEKFIDTPVKRYSSGMYVRLAFAVAAHLEPEILVVDEVLAVGDVEFQKKCMGKMNDVARHGRTVILVSHQLHVMEQLAVDCVLLEKGRVRAFGPTAEVITLYQGLHAERNDAEYDLTAWPRTFDTDKSLEFISARHVGRPTQTIPADAPLVFDVGVTSTAPPPEFRISFTIHQLTGAPVGSTFGPMLTPPSAGKSGSYRVTLDDHCLAPGAYYLDMAVGRGTNETGMVDYDIVRNVLHFRVMNPEADGNAIANWHPGWGPVRFHPASAEAI